MSEAHDPPDLGEPPDPPELPRRIHLYTVQWIGLPILFVLPVLALLKVFESRAAVERVHGPLTITVEHPTRIRAGQRTDVQVRIVNRGAESIPNVAVHWDPGYLARFASIQRVAPGDDLPDEAFDVQSGEERIERIELEGNALWQHRGYVAVARDGSDTTRIDLRTFVFP